MPFFICKVKGQSMAPWCESGDFVIGMRWFVAVYRPGDVVVVRHARFGLIIKRIQSIDKNEGVWLCGDNPSSTSTERLGVVPVDALQGRIICRVTPRSCYAKGD
ncbi:MAG: S24 family peptidase [Pontibacterium sp.]